MWDTQLCSDLAGTLLGQWIHVSVVRRMTSLSGTAMTYKVYVNGILLEPRAYPAGTRGGSTYDYSLGESDQIPAPRSGGFGQAADFASRTALTFGKCSALVWIAVQQSRFVA